MPTLHRYESTGDNLPPVRKFLASKPTGASKTTLATIRFTQFLETDLDELNDRYWRD
jgi:hypothetical protein